MAETIIDHSGHGMIVGIRQSESDGRVPHRSSRTGPWSPIIIGRPWKSAPGPSVINTHRLYGNKFIHENDLGPILGGPIFPEIGDIPVGDRRVGCQRVHSRQRTRNNDPRNRLAVSGPVIRQLIERCRTQIHMMGAIHTGSVAAGGTLVHHNDRGPVGPIEHL